MPRYTGLEEFYITKKKKILISPKSINPNIFLNSQFTYYKVKDNDTLDGIAYDYYGKGDAYDIIMYANNLSLPTDIEVGKILIIPLNYKDAVQTIIAYNQS